MCGGVCTRCFCDFLRTHLGVLAVVSIAEGTLQVASGESDEYGWSAGEKSFALQGIENLIYSHCSCPQMAAFSKPGFTYAAMFPSDSWKVTL